MTSDTYSLILLKPDTYVDLIPLNSGSHVGLYIINGEVDVRSIVEYGGMGGEVVALNIEVPR